VPDISAAAHAVPQAVRHLHRRQEEASMTLPANPGLESRIDRIESTLAIQQLPIRYALAVDGRDIDAWLGLFVPDVDCGRHGRGRDALRGTIEPELRRFYRSIHLICGHHIEFDDEDHAHGHVYCRAEHEDGEKWIVMAICYVDQYARRDGAWYFVRRREQHWYAMDALDRPGVPFQRWAGHDVPPKLPAAFPTWATFWQQSAPADVARLTGEAT
jgi:hypothetical protein